MNLVAAAPQWLVGLLALLLLTAAVQDAVRLKISNLIIAGVLVAGLAAAIVVGVKLAIWQNVVVFALVLTIGFALFAAGKLGGGDVKLFAATGFWFDFASALGLLVAVLIAGGFLALVMISLRLAKWSEQARNRIIILQPKSGIPYAIAIAIGGLLSILVQRS